MSIRRKQMIDLHKDSNIDKWEWVADGEYLVIKKQRVNAFTNIANHITINTIIGGLLTATLTWWITDSALNLSSVNIYIIVPLIAALGALMSFAISYFYSEAYNVARMRVSWDYYADNESLDNIRRLPQIAARLNLLKAKISETNSTASDKEYYTLLSRAEDSTEGSWGCDMFRNYYSQHLNDFFNAPREYNNYKNDILAKNNVQEVIGAEVSKRYIPGSEMDVLFKIIEEFPNANKLVKISHYLDELSASDYHNFQVIVDELTKHYYTIMVERDNGNGDLAEIMINKFTPLVNKSVIIVNRMMDSINQAKLDQIEISNTFISEKFYLNDDRLIKE